MKFYENIAAIAAAEPDEMAARCGISAAAARAVRAAARLALENRVTQQKRLNSGGRRNAGGAKTSGAGLAAEAADGEYGGGAT
jgi:hypothetical protein